MEVFYKLVAYFDGFSQACPNYPGKFAIFLWHPKKEAWNEVKNFTALAGSNTALAIYYTFKVLPEFPFSSLNMKSMPSLFFIWLLACVTSLSFFQIAVGPFKLACFSYFLYAVKIRPFIINLFIINRPQQDFFVKNTAFQLTICH